MVRRTVDAGLPLSVRGGGHDWAGRAVREGGVVIDLSPMNRVAVSGDVAHVGGGATSLDVMEAAVTAGQTVVTGTSGSVGMAGLALGGGYGPQLGSAGLACDQIVGAQVVLADGSTVTAPDDLLRALRGGGGNFGVVTELHLRLRPFATALTGAILFPWAQAHQVLHAWASVLADVPDELAVQVGSLTGPDGARVIAANPTWVGPAPEGRHWVRVVEGWGTPLVSQVASLPLTETLRATDELFPADGRSWHLRTRNLPALTPEVIGLLVEAGSSAPPGAAFGMHHFHGRATRPVLPSAFGQRAPHLMLELITSWREPAESHLGWSRDLGEALAGHALPGGYPNVLGPDDTDQIERAWGPDAARLLEAKAKYDPHNVFRGIPLPRAGTP
ncbi:FAD/FMN-containing dehydrogenase [Kineosporia succinea]|uniref:FAD/FMN-containing dehydrogenase n=1 Tax=Kineosporia succinea TaxID=84632 RepID=A0ABT9NZ77_9ACTN|nr:FAD/FMN-containing dehydrogenase [Kineosporia succinea]